jgi:hypothetical protein
MSKLAEREIPTFESVSPEYARLSETKARLIEQQQAINSEILKLHSRVADTGPNPVSREDRVRALVNGGKIEPAPNLRDRIADLARERDDLKLALDDVHADLLAAKADASIVINDGFKAEYNEMATEFFGHVVAASLVHSRYGTLERQLRSQGVEIKSLVDFGREFLGHPLMRNDTAGIELREAVKRGHLAARDLPEFAR